MAEIVLIVLFLIPAMLGLAELLHIFRLYILKPEKTIISYKLIFLTNESPAQQLLYAVEQYLWLGKKQGLNLIVVNSLLNEENLKECKAIAEKHNLIFCDFESLCEYFKIIV